MKNEGNKGEWKLALALIAMAVALLAGAAVVGYIIATV